MRSPVFLDESAYGRLVSRPETMGWNKSTHLAKVDFGLGEEDAYVKLMYQDHWPGLANEAIGWMLATACQMETPARAAIMVGDAKFWLNTLGTLPAGCPQTGDLAAWCTARCETDDHHTWVSLAEEHAAMAVLRSETGRKIAAFDTWLLNADRNSGNLLRTGAGRWAAIDHEMIFSGWACNWRKTYPNINGKSTLLHHLEALVKKGRIDAKADSQIRSAMVENANAHIEVIARALPYLAEVLEAIEPPKTAKSVLPLIVDRAWSFWMPAMVNKIV